MRIEEHEIELPRPRRRMFAIAIVPPVVSAFVAGVLAPAWTAIPWVVVTAIQLRTAWKYIEEEIVRGAMHGVRDGFSIASGIPLPALDEVMRKAEAHAHARKDDAASN